MAGRVTCQNCGGRVDVPAGHTRAKIRCPGCGYYAEIPPDLRGVAGPADDDPPPAPPARTARPPAPPPTPAVDDILRPGVARPVRPAAAKPVPVDPPPILEGTQEEDDDKPYAVPSDGTKTCPECRGRIPFDATFCTRCGTHIRTGWKPKKQFEPINRTWEYRWPLKTRLGIFLGFQVVNLVLALAVSKAAGSPLLAFFSLGLQAALQAFLVGSYETFTVRRTAKGQATLTSTWRVAFIPLVPSKLRWQDSHAVGISGTSEAGLVAWGMFIYLCIFTCLLPGLVFWYFVIRPDRFDIVLADVYGSTNLVAFRAITWDEAAAVVEVIRQATGLADQRDFGKKYLDAPHPADDPPGGRATRRAADDGDMPFPADV